MRSWRTGVQAFRFVAAGQLVSMLGSSVGSFALTVWAFEKTGSATALGLVSFFHLLPLVVMSPFAGAIVDRSNRRLMLMLSDLGAFAVTLVILMLHLLGGLEIWHILAGMVVIGLTEAFQGPAYAAAISHMVRPEDYPRANAALGLADSARNIGGPALAAILYPLLGLGGVLTVDLVSFAAAFAVLLFIEVPQPPAAPVSRVNWLEETSFGFRYIWARPGLRALVSLGLLFSFAFGLSQAVEPALLLSRGGETALAVVRTSMGIGGIVGGLLVSTWGAPKRRIVGSVIGMSLYALGLALFGLSQHALLWGLAGALTLGAYPLLSASGASIWQQKVDRAVQGKVLAARQAISFVSSPLGTLLAGPLADRVLTPATRPDGSLAPLFGPLLGTGPGAGFALMMLICAVWVLVLIVYSLLNPTIRNVESVLPDAPRLEPNPASSSAL